MESSMLTVESSAFKYHDKALLTQASSAALTSFSLQHRSNDKEDRDENEDTMPDELKVYTSKPSKNAFYRSYREVGQRRHLWIDFNEPTRADPCVVVQEYMKSVIEKDRIPMPALLKQTRLRALDISNQGLGDDFVVALGEVLIRLPYIVFISIRNSRCTDVGVNSIVKRAEVLMKLESLDVSENEIGACSAISLRNYLNSHKCTLRRLVMSKADVDDGECNEFMSALQINKSVTELNLSQNLIGASENLNIVKPDLVTGGEAIAQMLCTNETLRVLDVSWNSIRGDSAIEFAQSLRCNQTLRTLKLAYNTFGDKGSQYIGMSLLTNRSIERLDLSYNSVSPAAAMVIANALVDNDVMRLLNLDGNKVGVRGAASLMGALRSGNDILINRSISLDNCDTTFDNESLFNPLAPQGNYTLQLKNPYDNMVAEALLHLATKRDGCSFASLKYTASSPKARPKQIKLTRATATPTERSTPSVNWQKILRQISAHKKCQKGCALSPWDCEMDDATCGECSVSIAGPDFIADDCGVPTLREPNPPPPPKRPEYVYKVQGPKGAGYYGKGQQVHFCRQHKYILCKSCNAPAIKCDSIKEIFASFGLTTSEVSNQAVAEWINTKLLLIGHSIKGDHITEFCFRATFCLVDKDHGGSLDRNEILESMSFMGLQPSEKEVDRLIAQYDVDGGGTMEEEEFVTYMMSKYVGRELHTEKLPLCDKGVEWYVPKEGVLQVQFTAEPMLPSDEEVGSDAGVQALLENLQRMPSDAERKRVFEMAVTGADVYFTPQQAQDLMDAVFRFMGKAKTLEHLLPLLPTVISRVQIVQTNLSIEEQWQLRVSLGATWKILLGNPSGHYTLDMGKVKDRLTATLIAKVANHERQISRDKSGGRGDTSQHGNWCNFRNETFNGVKVVLDPSWFTNIPNIGKLRFDYVSTDRPTRNINAISSARFEKVRKLVKIEGAAINHNEYIAKMENMDKQTKSIAPGDISKVGDFDTRNRSLCQENERGRLEEDKASFKNADELVRGDDDSEDPEEFLRRRRHLIGDIISLGEIDNFWTEMKETGKRHKEAKELSDLQEEEIKKQAEKDRKKGGAGSKKNSRAAPITTTSGLDGSTLGAESLFSSYLRRELDIDELRFLGVPGLVELEKGQEEVKFLELEFEGDNPIPVSLKKLELPMMEPKSPTGVKRDPLKDNREIVLEAVKRNGYWGLLYASDALKDDQEIVLEAVKKYGSALQCASPALKDNREIVLAAVNQNRNALQYASTALKDDREVVLAAIKQTEYASHDGGTEEKNIFSEIAEIGAASSAVTGVSLRTIGSEITGMTDKDSTTQDDTRPNKFIIAVPEGLKQDERFNALVPGRGVCGPLYGALYAGHDILLTQDGDWMQQCTYQTMIAKPKIILDVKSEDVLDHPEENLEPTKSFACWYALLLKVEVSLCLKYVTVDQALDLFHMFPEDQEIRTLFLVTIFGRILDLNNFYRLVDLIEPAGKLEVYYRLGHLNVLCPLVVERWYELDLGNHDEREMCRVLAKLAVKEEGLNWQGEHFKRKKLDLWLEGWELPKYWDVDDDGGQAGTKGKQSAKQTKSELPSEGVVNLQYYVEPKHREVEFRNETLKSRFLCGQKNA